MPSMLRHEAVEPKHYQADGYNCGLIAFILCLEKFKKVETIHKLSQEEQNVYVHEIRVKFISIITDVWLILNDGLFDSLKDHVSMEHGEATNKHHVNKWLVCHKLFDYGKFDYKKKKAKKVRMQMTYLKSIR